MRVPEYQQSVQQQGLPNARLTTHYTADDFLSGTQKAAMQVGTDLAKSLAHDAKNLAVDHYKQQLQESIHDQTRDADTQYRTQKQNAMYGVEGVNGQPRTPGFLDLQGKSALAPTANGQSPASVLQDDLKAKRAAITDTLTSDSAKRDFNEHADNEDFHTNGMIQQHEGQQTRVFRANTLTADNDSLSREIEQGYNDPNRMQLAYDKLKKNNDEFARLNGLDERAGGIAARTQFSKAVKVANEAAIQNNDYQSADNNIRRFGAELDVNTTSDLKQSSFNAYTTALIQTDPQKVIDMTAPKTMPAMEFERVKQIRDAVESHGKDYNPDGSAVTHIDKDGIKSKYKNQVREDVAKDPGFGIKPAANDSPEEYNRVGDELLKAHYDYHKGDVEKTLAAYNGGRKGVDDAITSGGDWQAKAGVKDYLAKARLEANKTGTPMDYGTPMQHLHANNAAEAMIEKGRVNFKVGLESAYKDQRAQAYNTGNPGEPIPLSTFNQAYGEHGPEMHASYQDNISHAVQAFSIRDMPTANINKLLEDEKPKDNSPDAEREWKQYDELVKAAKFASDTREKDPIAAAARMGLPVSPVDWSNPVKAAVEIAKRTSVSAQMESNYGTPSSVLTKDEAENLSNTFQSMPVKDSLKFMTTLHQSAPEGYRLAMQQIMPKDPVTALAGLYASTNIVYHDGDNAVLVDGHDNAQTILEGNRLLNPTDADKKSMPENQAALFKPKKTDFETEFNAAIGNAFSQRPQEQAMAYQAAMGFYAGSVAKNGKPDSEIDLINQSIKAATGGIINFNGGQVIPPYQMPEDLFVNAITKKFTSAVADSGRDPKLYPLSDYKITMSGENKYRFANGNSFLPIEVNLN